MKLACESIGGCAGILEGTFSLPRGSIRNTASSVRKNASTETVLVTTTSLADEYGSRKWPAVPAVITKPTIIITQTMVAAAARRFGVDPLGEEGQQRGAGGANPGTDHHEGHRRKKYPRQRIAGHPGGGDGGEDAADGEARPCRR